jgi:Uma2 family endonuclease
MAATRVFQTERLYTADEFEQMPQFHERYELIEGKVVEKPMPIDEHSLMVLIFLYAYKDFDPKLRKGIMLPEISVKLNTKNTPAPDIGYWVYERKPGRARKAAPMPDLAIEVWSPHDWETQERLKTAREKCERYILNGVKLVWAVNSKNQTVEVYRPGDNGTVQVETLGIDDVLYSGEVARDFSISVRRLFEDEADE